MTKAQIKALFETGDRPSQGDFANLIDSYQDINTLPSSYYMDTGVTNTYVITPNPAFTSLSSLIGIPLYIKIGNSNAGASTLNVNGLGATPITYITGNSLSNAALPGGAVAGFIYDGTEFQFINITPTSGGAFITALTGDVTASGSGSVAATISAAAVTTNKIADANVTLPKLATQAADTVLVNATSSPASPTAVALTASTLLGKGSTGNIGPIAPNTGLVFAGANLNVDVGTTANKIVQLNGSGQMPAVDGSTLLNLPGSYAFLGSATASSSASLDFTSLITSAYDEYVFELQDVRITAGASLLFRTSPNNGSTYNAGASDYAWSGTTVDTTPTQTAVGLAVDTSIIIAAATSNTVSNAICGTLKLYNPLGTTNDKNVRAETNYVDSTSSKFVTRTMGGRRLATAAINAVRFIPDGSTITSGLIRMYGIKNS